MIKGIGVDLVEVKRFREKLTDELIEEVFLPEETRYCRSQVRYWESYAARFAAKEAAFKSLGMGLSSGLRFRDVEVLRDPVSGSVGLKLHGKASKAAREKEILSLHLSMSHTGECAIAMVFAEGSPPV